MQQSKAIVRGSTLIGCYNRQSLPVYLLLTVLPVHRYPTEAEVINYEARQLQVNNHTLWAQ